MGYRYRGNTVQRVSITSGVSHGSPKPYLRGLGSKEKSTQVVSLYIVVCKLNPFELPGRPPPFMGGGARRLSCADTDEDTCSYGATVPPHVVPYMMPTHANHLCLCACVLTHVDRSCKTVAHEQGDTNVWSARRGHADRRVAGENSNDLGR